MEPLTLHLKSIAQSGSLIILIARDDVGHRYTIQVRGFKPYFYVERNVENLKDLKKKGFVERKPGGEPHLLEYEDGIPAIDGTPTYRVYVDTPATVSRRRKAYHCAPCTGHNCKGCGTWEADIPYTRRFLVDTGIHDGFRLEGTVTRIGTADHTTLIVDASQIRPVAHRNKDRQMQYDIETNKPEGSKHYSPPLEAEGAVTALTLHDSFVERQYRTMWWHPHRGTPGVPHTDEREKWSDAYQAYVPWTVVTYGTEREFMVAVLQHLKDTRPDVMQAWNGHHGLHRKNLGGFDMPYLINRLRKLGIPAGQLSPLGNVFAGFRMFGKESKNAKGNNKFQCSVDGIQLVDGMTTYQIKEGGFTAQVPFTDLKRVTEKFTRKKLKKDPTAIEDWWLNNSEQFLSYSFDDVDALVALERSEGYLQFARDMQHFVGAEDADRLFTPMALINCMLLRIAREEGVCVPTSDSEDEEYEAEGGFVLDPQIKGLQRRVGVLDLTTMYVHIIISGNLSPETHVPNPTEEQMRDLICVPSDLGPQFFLKPSVKVGILPKVCQRFRAVRKKYDDLIEAAATAEEVKKLKHARQPAKQILLGVWGTSLSKFFCLFKPEVGSSITGTGRYIIQNTREFVKSLGNDVFYVDTDSNFVSLPTNRADGRADETTVQHGEWLAGQINGFFDQLAKTLNMDSHGFEIGLETIYDPFVMGDTKKMYAGYIVWSEGKWQVDEQGKPLPDEKTGKPRDIFTATGIPGIKSDAAPITRDTSDAVLRAILNGVRPLEIIEYVRAIHDGVLSGDIPLDEIVKAVGMNMDLDDPDETQTHIVRGARHGRSLYDFEYPAGGKVRLMRLRGAGENWVAIPDGEDLPKDVPLDLEHHADLTVIRPVQSIMEWIDVDLSSVRHGTAATTQKRL